VGIIGKGAVTSDLENCSAHFRLKMAERTEKMESVIVVVNI